MVVNKGRSPLKVVEVENDIILGTDVQNKSGEPRHENGGTGE